MQTWAGLQLLSMAMGPPRPPRLPLPEQDVPPLQAVLDGLKLP